MNKPPVRSPLLKVENLTVHFPVPGGKKGVVCALDNLNLSIVAGQIVGIVGESGSGKTTLGRSVLGLQRATDGRIFFDGDDIASYDKAAWRGFRCRMQMVPQDAAASLSPRFTVAGLFDEVFVLRGIPKNKRRSAADLLAMVELGPEHAEKYPHELSGGQARRVSIARTLAMEPNFIVADEVIAGLDVSAVASIINLLARLRTELRLTYLFITHDLDVVAYLADVTGVMYLGQLVETGPAVELVEMPKHPYTRSLLAARSHNAPDWRLTGEIPSPRSPPSGCRFHTRCRFARPICSQKEPPLERCGPHDHVVACHFWKEIDESHPPQQISSSAKEAQ